MDPRLYLTLAGDLADRAKRSAGLVSAGGEPECRSAISRAYYASFHVALELLDRIGLAVTSAGSCHIIVQYGLNNSGNLDLQTVSSHLGTLYTERRYADYEMHNARAENAVQAEQLTQLSLGTVVLIDHCRLECQNDFPKGQALASTI